MLLCDWAEELNGKLYIMGAGWSQVVANQPGSIALGVLLFIPWDQTNRPHNLEINLVTEDGAPVEIEGRPLNITGKIEVGRPVGMRSGSRLEAPMALRFPSIQLSPGRYRFELLVNGVPLAIAPFEAKGS
jgi:hypothetical protein